MISLIKGLFSRLLYLFKSNKAEETGQVEIKKSGQRILTNKRRQIGFTVRVVRFPPKPYPKPVLNLRCKK